MLYDGIAEQEIERFVPKRQRSTTSDLYVRTARKHTFKDIGFFQSGRSNLGRIGVAIVEKIVARVGERTVGPNFEDAPVVSGRERSSKVLVELGLFVSKHSAENRARQRLGAVVHAPVR